MKKKVLNILYAVFSSLFFALGAAIVFGVIWWKTKYGIVGAEQLLYNLMAPMDGANTEIVSQILRDFCIFALGAIIVFVIAVTVIAVAAKNGKNVKRVRIKLGKFKKTVTNYQLIKAISFIMSAVFLFVSFAWAFVALDIKGAIDAISSETLIYQNECVFVADTKITFPEKKKNLIYIFLESVESSFAAESAGGGMEESLIPELEALALEGETFSCDGNIGGALVHGKSAWTVAALVTHTTGVPLSVPDIQNSYGKEGEPFLPGVISIGDVLEDNGYNQMFMCGSDIVFGGRKYFFEQHGNYDIYDYYTAKHNEKFSDDYYVFWGYEDIKLFDYAKEELLRLSGEDKPFNFSMLTVDTHFGEGYVCSECGNEYDVQYQNVYSCSSKHVASFVEWIKQQDFYDDTVIVIAGDHLTMSSAVEEWYADDYNTGDRKTYFTILNSDTENKRPNENRVYTTLDIFPTTLSAIGCKIESHRLGLGVDLYSGEQTLAEKYGLGSLFEELSKSSTYYINKFASGQPVKLPVSETYKETGTGGQATPAGKRQMK